MGEVDLSRRQGALVQAGLVLASEALGAALEIDTTDGQGTAVRLRLPLREEVLL